MEKKPRLHDTTRDESAMVSILSESLCNCYLLINWLMCRSNAYRKTDRLISIWSLSSIFDFLFFFSTFICLCIFFSSFLSYLLTLFFRSFFLTFVFTCRSCQKKIENRQLIKWLAVGRRPTYDFHTECCRWGESFNYGMIKMKDWEWEGLWEG